MLRMQSLVLAAVVTAIGAAPAAAAWTNIGQVRFDTGMTRGRLGGPSAPVRTLTLTARNNPMYCASVRVHFNNGERADVFSGPLAQGRRVDVDIPGRARRIASISFRCRSTHNWAAVEVGARTGRGGWDRDDHRRGWEESARTNVGQLRFDTGMTRGRLGGPSAPVRTLTLTARNNPMYCASVRVHFNNGERADVFSGPLAQGRRVDVDIPGRARRIASISFRCRSTHNWAAVEVDALTGRGGWDRDR